MVTLTRVPGNISNPDDWVQVYEETTQALSVNEDGRVQAPIGRIGISLPIGRPVYAVRINTSGALGNPRWKWGGKFSLLTFTGVETAGPPDTIIGTYDLLLNRVNLCPFPDIGAAYSAELNPPNWFPDAFVEVWQYIGSGVISQFDLGLAIYNEVRNL